MESLFILDTESRWIMFTDITQKMAHAILNSYRYRDKYRYICTYLLEKHHQPGIKANESEAKICGRESEILDM